MKRLIGFIILAAVSAAQAAPDPETVFRNPPPSAKTGVWWHWMGCNVTKEGIVKDLDWFKETGIGAAKTRPPSVRAETPQRNFLRVQIAPSCIFSVLSPLFIQDTDIIPNLGTFGVFDVDSCMIAPQILVGS